MLDRDDPQERSICEMYRGGASLRTLELAFERSTEEIIRVLHRHGVVRQEEGESWARLVDRVRQDVKHGTAA